MKVVVIDDEATSRLMLRRIFERHFSSTVIEAKNGVEGLEAIERESPDLVLLDVVMPIMDGVAVLETLRATPEYANLPVVSISAGSERSMVLKLLSLGVVDYLLKPISLEEARDRLKSVMAAIELRAGRNAAAGDPDGLSRQMLLVADRDAEFLAFTGATLDAFFEVVVAEGGPSAVRLYLEKRPEIVWLAKGLELLDEKAVARTIKANDQKQPPRVFLIADDADDVRLDDEAFDGVINKSLEPEGLLRQVSERILGAPDALTLLRAISRHALEPALVEAARQTIGVMTSEDVEQVDPAEYTPVPAEEGAIVELTSDEHGLSLTLGIYATQADAAEIGKKVQAGDAEAGSDGGSDGPVLNRLVDAIGARIEQAVGARGIPMHPGSVEPLPVGEGDPPDWDLSVPVRTEGGEQLAVGLRLSHAGQPAVAAADEG